VPSARLGGGWTCVAKKICQTLKTHQISRAHKCHLGPRKDTTRSCQQIIRWRSSHYPTRHKATPGVEAPLCGQWPGAVPVAVPWASGGGAEYRPVCLDFGTLAQSLVLADSPGAFSLCLPAANQPVALAQSLTAGRTTTRVGPDECRGCQSFWDGGRVDKRRTPHRQAEQWPPGEAQRDPGVPVEPPQPPPAARKPVAAWAGQGTPRLVVWSLCSVLKGGLATSATATAGPAPQE